MKGPISVPKTLSQLRTTLQQVRRDDPLINALLIFQELAERRQVISNIVFSVVFLFLGWLLSIFGTPQNLAHVLGLIGR